MQASLYFPSWLISRLLVDLADHPIFVIAVAVIAIAAFIFWLFRNDQIKS
jgi:hypothetical protein